jgi:DNA mismatch endonuclease (patch repair protein)
MVFTKAHVAVYVDGCFWHCCPTHGTKPKANGQWWAAKLDANKRRDAATVEALENEGWRVVRIWEHEDPVEAAQRVRQEVLSVARSAP